MTFSPHFLQDMEINAEELRNVLNNVVKKREFEHVFTNPGQRNSSIAPHPELDSKNY